jgi:hypothetical protein
VTAHEACNGCCYCGEEGGPLEWVEDVGHRLCASCAAGLNRAIWARIQHGVQPRDGLSGVQTAFREAASVVPWRCAAPADEVPLCVIPPMRVALVAGVHPPGFTAAWVLLDRGGEFGEDVLKATLFPFTREGAARAREASEHWDEVVGPQDWVKFVARVLVVGRWDHPSDVIPAWRLEGHDAPGSLRYPWDE